VKKEEGSLMWVEAIRAADCPPKGDFTPLGTLPVCRHADQPYEEEDLE